MALLNPIAEGWKLLLYHPVEDRHHHYRHMNNDYHSGDITRGDLVRGYHKRGDDHAHQTPLPHQGSHSGKCYVPNKMPEGHYLIKFEG